MASDSTLEAPARHAGASNPAKKRRLDSVEQMLTPQQHAALRADLAEIARLRREAEHAASQLILR